MAHEQPGAGRSSIRPCFVSDRALLGGACAVGLIPIIAAQFDGQPWGVEPSLGMMAILLALAALVGESRRSTPQSLGVSRNR
jgi:hypothetical protein